MMKGDDTDVGILRNHSVGILREEGDSARLSHVADECFENYARGGEGCVQSNDEVVPLRHGFILLAAQR